MAAGSSLMNAKSVISLEGMMKIRLDVMKVKVLSLTMRKYDGVYDDS